MKRAWRWLKRIVLGALALVVLAIVVVLVVLHTDWGRERVRRQVEAALRDQFPGGATIGRLEGSVFGELVVRDVAVAALDGQPLLEARELRVDVALLPLLRKTIRVNHASASGVVVTDPERPFTEPAQDDEDEPDDEPASPSAWAVEAPNLALREVTIARRGAAPMTIAGLALDASVALPAGDTMEANVARLSGIWRERDIGFDVALRARLGAVPELHDVRVEIGAGLRITAAKLVLDPARPAGAVSIVAPAAVVAALVPSLAATLPADVRVELAIAPRGDESIVQVAGSIGKNRITGLVRGSLPARRGDAFVLAVGDELELVSRGELRGQGTALATLAFDAAGIRGLLQGSARIANEPAMDATIAVSATLGASALGCELPIAHATATVLATGAGGLNAAAHGRLTNDACALRIVDDARLVASVGDPRAASGGRADVAGELALDATVHGTVWPRVDVGATGQARGRRVRQAELAVSAVQGTFTARYANDAIAGTAEATATGVARAGELLGRATARAETRDGKQLAVRATVWPAIAGARRVDATATVTLPDGPTDDTRIALGTHAVALANGMTWKGRGGVVTLGEDVQVVGFATSNGPGKLAVDATVRASGAIEARVDATAIPAAFLDPAYRGTATGRVALTGRGVRWDGTATMTMRGFATTAEAAPLDADLAITVAGRQVTVDAAARTDRLGRVQFVLDVEGPRDLLDAPSWQRLERRAIRTASLRVDRVDLGAAGLETGGIVDGKLYFIAGAAEKNELSIRDVQTPVGVANGTLVFAAADNDELGAAGSAHVEGVGDANITARFKFPDRPFDPRAWRALGRGVARELVVVIDDVQIDPRKLAALGVQNTDYHGRADIQLGIHPGEGQAELHVDLHALRGGQLVKPLDLEIRARSDARGTAGSVALIDPAATVATARNLVVLDGRTPVTFARWLNEPLPMLVRAPLAGSLTVPPLEARRLLAYFGRLDRIAGRLGGAFTIRGTLGVPTVRGELVARDIEGPPGIEGGRAPKLHELGLAIDWGGVAGRIELRGIEDRGRMSIFAQGRPTDLSSVLATAKFTRFDLAPIAALLPGALAASTGYLDGDLAMNKFDPVAFTGIGGWLELSRARIPLLPMLGTLHRARARLDYNDQGLKLRIDGPRDDVTKRYDAKLGQSGWVHLVASAPRDLSTLDATLQMRDVQLIGEVEPIITGTAKARLVRQGVKWVGRVDVTNTSVVVPEEVGEDLADSDAPSDLYIVEEGVKLDRKPMFVLGARAPDDPSLVIDVNLMPIRLDAAVLDDFAVRAQISGNLKVSVGDTLGVLGRVGIDRGTVDVLGRIYQIDAASEIVFDGTTDGKLAIDLSHNFPSMTLFVALRNRISNPDPQLSSDPAIYTQGQLAGFLAGGDPGGDVTTQTREAATGTGAALLGAKLSKRLKRVLPVKLDVIRFDLATSTTGASWSVGRWLSDSVYLGWKQRLEARPDENTGDLQLQWHFMREWLIEGVGGDRNRNGVDLLWRRRW